MKSDELKNSFMEIIENVDYVKLNNLFTEEMKLISQAKTTFKQVCSLWNYAIIAAYKELNGKFLVNILTPYTFEHIFINNLIAEMKENASLYNMGDFYDIIRSTGINYNEAIKNMDSLSNSMKAYLKILNPEFETTFLTLKPIK